jgi:hypothetical protein
MEQGITKDQVREIIKALYQIANEQRHIWETLKSIENLIEKAQKPNPKPH